MSTTPTIDVYGMLRAVSYGVSNDLESITSSNVWTGEEKGNGQAILRITLLNEKYQISAIKLPHRTQVLKVPNSFVDQPDGTDVSQAAATIFSLATGHEYSGCRLVLGRKKEVFHIDIR